MIRTFSQAMEDPIRGIEILDQHSDTVPDMSLSVREILERFRRGTVDINDLSRDVIDSEDDFDDDLLDDINDLVDIQERKEVINGKISENLQHHRDSVDSSERNASEEQVSE